MLDRFTFAGLSACLSDFRDLIVLLANQTLKLLVQSHDVELSLCPVGVAVEEC